MTRKLSPLVTIGIPTYNRAGSYLKQALESALNQTYHNIEIIVSDNCSTDNTESFVAGFSDPRIHYFKQPTNIAVQDNFNFCLKQANGDYFLLLHDDDVIDHDFVDTCMHAVRHSSKVGLVRTGTRIIDSHGTTLSERTNRVAGLSTTDFFLGWMDNKTVWYFCSSLFNTENLKAMGGLESKTHLFQDAVAIVKLSARYGRADVYDVKAGFRRHLSNRAAAPQLINDWCDDGLYVLNTMCNMIPEEHKAVLRHKGMSYFCRKYYGYASGIKSPVHRLLTYLMVAKKFDYTYSPIRYAYHVEIQSRMRAIPVKVKRLLSETPGL